MLPDFPALKARLLLLKMLQVRKSAESAAPLFASISGPSQHEGDCFEYETLDGKIAQKRFREFNKTFEIPGGLTAEQTFRAAGSALADLSRDLGEDVEKSIVDLLEDACSAEGQRVDAAGAPPSPEHLLEALDRMEISFDFHGVAGVPTFVAHPAVAPAIESAWATLTSSARYKTALEELIIRKRRDWIIRQGRRKLVG